MNSSSVMSPSWSTSNFPKIFCNFRKFGKTWSHNCSVKKNNMFAFQISILDAYVRSFHCHVMVQALCLVYCGKHLKQLQNFTHVNTSIYLPHLDHFLDVNCAGAVPVVKLERPVQFVPEWSVIGSWECSIFQIKRSLAQN